MQSNNRKSITRGIVLAIGMLTVLFAGYQAFGQMTGVIHYDITVDMHRNIPPEQELLKTRIPEFRTTKMRLFFNGDESLFKVVEEDRLAGNGFQGGGGFRGNPGGGGGNFGQNGGGFRGSNPGGGPPPGGRDFGGNPGGGAGPGGFRSPDGQNLQGRGGFAGGGGGFTGGFGRQNESEVFLSQSKRIIVEKRNFLGKTYFIKDSVELAPWKLGTDRKIILGYLCRMAYYTDTTNPEAPVEITAWFTDKLRPFIGPDRYNTLPGAVLAADLNGGEKVYVATKVDLRPLTKDEAIGAPQIDEKNAPMTFREYRKMEEEQLKTLGDRAIFLRN